MASTSTSRPSFTWSSSHKYGQNHLAQQFPSFKIAGDHARQGDVKVEARSPSGRTQQCPVYETNGVFTANFTPQEVGDWHIAIKYDGQNIKGSPFNVRVYDASRVRVLGLEGGAIGKLFNFQVDCNGAGDGELSVTVTHNNRLIPNVQLQPDGPSKYRVCFTPEGGGIYEIRVYFAGMEVSGSPYHLEIIDSSNVTGSGEGLHTAEVGRPALFHINTHGATGGDIVVNITSPRGAPVPTNVSKAHDGNIRVEYNATEVGDYNIDIIYHNKPIAGSPFRAHAYDWSRILVKNLKNSGMIGKMVEFDIDAMHAGSGNLEIMVNDGTIPCSVQNRGNRQFHASFVPKEGGPHYIQMKFNGREVPGSPWRVDIRSPANLTVSGDGLTHVCVRQTAFFEVRTGRSTNEGNLSVTITSPTHGIVPNRIMSPQPGVYRVEWSPMEVGQHQIEVHYDGVPIPNSPFFAKSYDPSAIIVSNIPNGIVGKPCEFTINVTQAGEGQLEIMVNRGSVPNTVKMLHKGEFLVSFVPRDTRPHVIDVKFNGALIPGCPMPVRILDASRVTVQGDGIRQVAVNKASYFRVNTQAAGEADLTVRVTSPNGDLVPAKIVQQADGDYKVEYSSKWTGRHVVEILYAGQPILGCPFYVEIYDPNKIRVEGVKSCMIGEPCSFEVINIDAGKADLGLTVLSPTNTQVHYDINPTPRGFLATYVPREVGQHNIFITYGGLEVPGCPLTQNVEGHAHITIAGAGLTVGCEDQPATFYVDCHGSRGDLFVQVDGPNSIAKCHIEPDPGMPGRYIVTYVPVEVGIYTITIKWNGKEINESPCHPRVVDPRKIRVVGGWQSVLDENNRLRLELHQEKRIEFDCSDAGPGHMTAEVRGPQGPCPVQVLKHSEYRYTVAFTPNIEGEYLLTVKWCDCMLPRAPYGGFARSAIAKINHEKVILTGRGLQEACVKEEAEFIIDGSEAGPGTPTVNLAGVKCEIYVTVTPLGGNRYRCTYVPQVPGAYLLSVMWSDRLVRGSPFKVNVIALSDASKVICSGEGLKMGIMGKEIKSIIDTTRAGPGELTAHCMGPHKVAYCELYDHRNGTFTLNIKPQEPGKHLLQIKYGGEHVPGSPFTLKVSGAPDASKVRVHGPGVEHGILATFVSRFIVETRGAGAGQLCVRIRGPKGAFCVEMQRESQKDRTILCRYDPTEVGDYIIHVKWSGDHVPGSPFHVQIFDTQEELERFARDSPGRLNTIQSTKSWHADF